MERPIFQPAGTPVKELDTPALLLDLDVASSNIQRLHQFFEDTSAKVRPHVGCHQCPRLAHRCRHRRRWLAAYRRPGYYGRGWLLQDYRAT